MEGTTPEKQNKSKAQNVTHEKKLFIFCIFNDLITLFIITLIDTKINFSLTSLNVSTFLRSPSHK